jgi:hypothetical protein
MTMIMKMMQKAKKALLASAITVASLAGTVHRATAQSVGDLQSLESNFNTNLQAGGTILFSVAILAGVVIVVRSIMGMHRDHQQQQPIGKHLAGAVFGVGLIAAPVVIGVLTSSLFSGTSASTSMQQVGFGSNQ